MAEYKYTLVIKARDVEDAKFHVDDWLSIPTTNAHSLGYNQVIVGVESNHSIEADLQEWHKEIPADANGLFPLGALVWWTS